MPRTPISADVTPPAEALRRRSPRAETAAESGSAHRGGKRPARGALVAERSTSGVDGTGLSKLPGRARRGEEEVDAEKAPGASKGRAQSGPAAKKPAPAPGVASKAGPVPTGDRLPRARKPAAPKGLAAKVSPSATGASKASPAKPAARGVAAGGGTVKSGTRKDVVAKAAGKEAAAKDVAAGARRASAPRTGGATGEKRAVGRAPADASGDGASGTEPRGAGPTGVGGHQAVEPGAGRHAAARAAAGRPSERSPAARGRGAEAPGGAGRRSPVGYASDAEFLARQRTLLLAERATYAEQAESLRAEAESLVEEMEPGDTQFDDESGEGGTLTVDRERDLALSAQAAAAVQEIDDALAKIERGTYGLCENCGEVIPAARLEALPYARLCVACKSGGLSRR